MRSGLSPDSVKHEGSSSSVSPAIFSSIANPRRVAVPNLGGFAALSYRFTNAKISAGYLADFFFGAMDGGLDTHRSVTTAFHGPFAKISVGLGG